MKSGPERDAVGPLAKMVIQVHKNDGLENDRHGIARKLLELFIRTRTKES
jgi:hypothetical protein